MNKHIAASLLSALFLTACSSSEKAPEPAKNETTEKAPPAEAPKAEAPPAEAPKAEPAKAEAPKAEPAKTDTAKAKDEPAKAAPAKSTPPAAGNKETTLSSGLRMIDSKEGQGAAVKMGNEIQVHYTGWLYENGKRGAKFDSSVDRGQPFVFTVGEGVIDGWSQGVVGMKPGGKRELIIPGALAYGPSGRPPRIPPNATLDFEIELLKVLR
jgi:peptidylprolyl isomerase